MINNKHNLSKEKKYIVNGREGQYELTTLNSKECFFMSDTDKYEYFDNPIIEETKLGIKNQIDKLRDLKDGWYNGDCKGYNPGHLDWLENKLNEVYLNISDLFISPTVDDNVVCIMWMNNPQPELFIDLNTKIGEMYYSFDEPVENYDLSNIDNWILINFLRI